MTLSLKHEDLLALGLSAQVCQDPEAVLHLTATFEPSIAFIIWHSLPVVADKQMMAQIWQQTLEACNQGLQGSDHAHLSGLAAIKHTDLLPADSLLYPPHLSHTSATLMAASTDTRLCSSQQAAFHSLMTAVQDLLDVTVKGTAVHMRLIAGNSFRTLGLSSHLDNLPRISERRVVLLRSMLLMVKLAVLALGAKHAADAAVTLWMVVKRAIIRFRMRNHTCDRQPTGETDLLTAADEQESRFLSALIVRLLLDVLQPASQSLQAGNAHEGRGAAADAFQISCLLLRELMSSAPWYVAQAAASEILQSGKAFT